MQSRSRVERKTLKAVEQSKVCKQCNESVEYSDICADCAKGLTKGGRFLRVTRYAKLNDKSLRQDSSGTVFGLLVVAEIIYLAAFNQSDNSTKVIIFCGFSFLYIITQPLLNALWSKEHILAKAEKKLLELDAKNQKDSVELAGEAAVHKHEATTEHEGTRQVSSEKRLVREEDSSVTTVGRMAIISSALAAAWNGITIWMGGISLIDFLGISALGCFGLRMGYDYIFIKNGTKLKENANSAMFIGFVSIIWGLARWLIQLQQLKNLVNSP